MPVRSANAVWQGNLKDGRGTMEFGSGAFKGQYSFRSRFEEGPGTNPEELIGAAHAGCFSMALAHGLSEAGHEPKKIETTATVHLEKGDDGFAITRIVLETDADVPGVDEAAFQRQVTQAKNGCPVSRALGGVEIEVDATLA